MVISRLKQGSVPWQLPWQNSPQTFTLPYNAITGKRYKGINMLSLLASGKTDPRWLTFRQAKAQGWSIMQGAKATLIQYIKTVDHTPQSEEQPKPSVEDESGETIYAPSRKKKPVITTAWVFNAAQIIGIPHLNSLDAPQITWDPIDRAEKLIAASQAHIIHQEQDRAYYDSIKDYILMPSRQQFSSPDKYYATLLHELGHWTAHASRLNRKINFKFGSPEYAREELIAEIASMILGSELQIGHDSSQHIAYLESWIQILSDAPGEIAWAALQAEKIFSFLMDLEKQNLYKKLPLKAQPQDPLGDNALYIGQIIAHMNLAYKVTGRIKRGKLQVQELQSGRTYTLSKEDELFNDLQQASQKSGSAEKKTSNEYE